MEFAAAALTAVGSAGAAAGAGAGIASTGVGALAAAELGVGAAGAASGGSLLGALGSVSTVGSILSGMATVGSIMSTRQAAETQAQSYELNANDAEINAAIERNQAIDKRTSLKAALVQAIGDRDVATAASGVDLSFGSPKVARQQAITDTERAITVSDETSDLRRSRMFERAASYRLMASQTRSGSLAKEASLGLGGLASIFKRG